MATMTATMKGQDDGLTGNTKILRKVFPFSRPDLEIEESLLLVVRFVMRKTEPLAALPLARWSDASVASRADGGT
jgi:hypothetical protein